LQKANARLERQEHHMHLLLKRIYGSTSEKFGKRPAEHVGGIAGPGRRGGRWRGERRGGARHNTRP